MGTCTMSCAVCVLATKVMYSGKAMMTMPRMSTKCEMAVARGRRSTISVIHLAFYVTELDDGEHHHDGHQHHGLRGRAAQVERLETVVIHLVDQDGRVLARPA